FFRLCLISSALVMISTAYKCYFEVEIVGHRIYPRTEITCETNYCAMFIDVIDVQGRKWNAKECGAVVCPTVGLGCTDLIQGGEVCCCKGDLCNKERPPVDSTTIAVSPKSRAPKLPTISVSYFHTVVSEIFIVFTRVREMIPRIESRELNKR
ncbi:hypothetical protein PMAYCL1PPCAC_33081, partial [Pristionchus mayeri]